MIVMLLFGSERIKNKRFCMWSGYGNEEGEGGAAHFRFI